MIALDASIAIARRELVRVLRQPARIVAAIGTPALMWVFFAGGFASLVPDASDAAGAPGSALFLLPGMVTLTATFSAIFSSISLINDRREGFLQSAIVSPAPAWAIATGKALGGSLVAFAQAGAIVLIAPLLSRDVGAIGIATALLAALCATLAVTGLGMALAWKVNSVEGFHGVMNLILTPMWLLSGAIFDPSNAPGWLRTLSLINPLTHVTEAMRDALAGSAPSPIHGAATLAFGAIGALFAVVSMARASRPGGANNPS